MGIYDDIKLAWHGREFTIPSAKVMGAIARIEDIVTLQELSRDHGRGGLPLAKLAMAYGAVLRYAGAEVSDEAVYDGMFGKAEAQDVILDVVTCLMVMMLPPSAKAATAKDAPRGNAEPAAAPS